MVASCSINNDGEMLAVVTIPDEHAGDIPWALKTCLYRQSIDTVYIALDYLDRVPGVKDLSPSELIETLDATRPVKAIPLQGSSFVPTCWMRETFPFEGVDLICDTVDNVARQAYAGHISRN